MKRLIALITLIFTATNANAKDIDNSKMGDLYKKQLEPTQQLVYETQQVLQASNAIVELSKNINSLGLEVKAINQHFIFLNESTTKLYGEYPTTTHFEACKQLPMKASFVWQAKIDNLRRDNSIIISNSNNDYDSTLKTCTEEMKTPPPLKIEDPGQLQIIDVE